MRALGKDRGDGLKPFCGSFESQSLLDPGQNKINEFEGVCKVGGVTKEQKNRQNTAFIYCIGSLLPEIVSSIVGKMPTQNDFFLIIFLDTPRCA